MISLKKTIFYCAAALVCTIVAVNDKDAVWAVVFTFFYMFAAAWQIHKKD